MIHTFDLIARVVLAPLLLAQALAVRRKALRMPEAAGPRQGVTGNGPDLRLLIIGDSSAAGVGAATQDQALAGRLVHALATSFQVHWQLHATTGATTAETLARMSALPAERFDVAVVALGVNDVTGAVPLEVWLARQRRLATVLNTRFGVRLICRSGLPPMGHFPLLPQPLRWALGRQATRFDRYLGRETGGAQIVHVPLDFPMTTDQVADDGFHPGPQIYAAWAGALSLVIHERLAAETPTVQAP